MGLLGDAINEHLELKRRRGSDPSEVARLEHDAFGPGDGAERSRDASHAPEDPVSAEPEHLEEPAELEAEPEPERDIAPTPEPARPPDLEPERAGVDLGTDLDEGLFEDRPADPQATQAMDALPDGEGDDSEDLLEETPEFLEETPDHDRLWFEQKPPKDFDFDG